MQFLKAMANFKWEMLLLFAPRSAPPASVSFWKNLPSHSEEISARRNLARAEKEASCMTGMRGVASAREVPSRMTVREDAAVSSRLSFRRNLFTRWEETPAQKSLAGAEKDASCMTEMRGVASAREVPSRMTMRRGAKHTPSSVSFWKNLPSHSEESHAQEGVAGAEKDASCMTEMRGVASAREVPSRMTVRGIARSTPPEPPSRGEWREALQIFNWQFSI